MFARYAKMSKAFARISKEVFLAVKAAGPNPETNPRLRAAFQNARMVNMPKERLEAAIKKATSKDENNLEQIVYEGFAPHGIAVLIECATDNPTRTVANIRSYFNKYGGSLGTSGSVDYLFEHKCHFRLKCKPETDAELLELDLIDIGCEELTIQENEMIVYGSFDSFGSLQDYFEKHDFEIIESGFDRIPTITKKLSPEQAAEVNKLLDRIEEDDDVQHIFSTME